MNVWRMPQSGLLNGIVHFTQLDCLLLLHAGQKSKMPEA